MSLVSRKRDIAKYLECDTCKMGLDQVSWISIVLYNWGMTED